MPNTFMPKIIVSPRGRKFHPLNVKNYAIEKAITKA